MGASLGTGSGQTLFGPAGPASLLTKITTGVAIVFMITSLALAVMSSQVSDNSVMENIPASEVFPAAEETQSSSEDSVNKAAKQATAAQQPEPAETKSAETKSQ